MKTDLYRTIGFAILILAWGIGGFTVGMFHEYPMVMELLFTMFILGMFTVLGMSMTTVMDKEERGFYHARKQRKKEIQEEIANVRKKKATGR